MATTPEGYEELIRREHDAIVRAAYVITGDAELARDVAQDAFAEVYVRWRTVERLDRPGAWLRRVAIRKAVRAANRERRRPLLERLSVGRAGGSSADADGSSGLDDGLAPLLSCLSPTQRAAIVLHYVEDRPVGEVADALGITPSTASVHLSRARARIGELLAADTTDDHEEVR